MKDSFKGTAKTSDEAKEFSPKKRHFKPNGKSQRRLSTSPSPIRSSQDQHAFSFADDRKSSTPDAFLLRNNLYDTIKKHLENLSGQIDDKSRNLVW